MPAFAVASYLSPYQSTLRPTAYYATWTLYYASYLVQPGLITLLQALVLLLTWFLPPLERWTETSRARMRSSDWASERWAWAHSGGVRPRTEYPDWVKTTRRAIDPRWMWVAASAWVVAKLNAFSAKMGWGSGAKPGQKKDAGMLILPNRRLPHGRSHPLPFAATPPHSFSLALLVSLSFRRLCLPSLTATPRTPRPVSHLARIQRPFLGNILSLQPVCAVSTRPDDERALPTARGASSRSRCSSRDARRRARQSSQPCRDDDGGAKAPFALCGRFRTTEHRGTVNTADVEYESFWEHGTSTAPHPPTVPTHTGGQPHGSGHHRSSSSISSLSQFGIPPVVPGAAPPALGPSAAAAPPAGPPGPNQTRILLLSNFSPSLKTKDLQDLVAEWQDDHGGLKVKWRDDTSAWFVFADPNVAKRAFLSLVSNPPTAISPAATQTYAPCITPYTGPDVPQILQAVQNRARSRSIAGQAGASGHARRGSGVSGSGGGAALAAASGAGNNPPGSGPGLGGGPPGLANPNAPSAGLGHAGGHNRTASWTRQSIDRRMAAAAAAAAAASSSSALPAGDFASTSPVEEEEGPELSGAAGHWRTSSPETPGGPGGIVAGDAPRRFGNPAAAAGGPGVNGHGHRRTDSRSGSDQVGIAVAGLTINE